MKYIADGEEKKKIKHPTIKLGAIVYYLHSSQAQAYFTLSTQYKTH